MDCAKSSNALLVIDCHGKHWNIYYIYFFLYIWHMFSHIEVIYRHSNTLFLANKSVTNMTSEIAVKDFKAGFALTAATVIT